MKLRKLSVVLLALLLAAMAVLPCVSADENDKSRIAANEKIRELINPVDADIHKIVDERILYTGQAETDRFSEPAMEVLIKYEKNLNEIVALLEKQTNVHLDEAKKTTLKEIIVTEHFKKVSNDMELEKRGLKLEDAKIIKPTILGIVNMTDEINKPEVDSLLSAPAMKLYQTYPDVYGGSGTDDAGYDYDVDGHNTVYKVLTWGNSYPYTYRLIYLDEDHPDPSLDATYDYYRCGDWDEEGCEDSAQFSVWDDNNLQYHLSWSGTHTYGYPIGNHGSVTKEKKPYIYVSNIWNHDIGTSDTNPTMSMLKMSVTYIPQ